MADKTHVNFGNVGNCVRNKAYPEEIWRDKGKKSNFQKVYKNFSVVNRHHMHKEKEKCRTWKRAPTADVNEELGSILKQGH